jgi:hypothetical protein
MSSIEPGKMRDIDSEAKPYGLESHRDQDLSAKSGRDLRIALLLSPQPCLTADRDEMSCGYSSNTRLLLLCYRPGARAGRSPGTDCEGEPMLCRFDSRVATASVPQRSQVRLRYNPYILFSAPYCTVPGDLASHVYSGRRRRSHVSPESRQYKQINKQTRRQASHQAREESTSTPPFEAKLCTDWISNIFHTIDWLWRSVGLPFKKRHVEINAMFLHDQIRRVPQHYSIGRYLLYRGLSRTSALHG